MVRARPCATPAMGVALVGELHLADVVEEEAVEVGVVFEQISKESKESEELGAPGVVTGRCIDGNSLPG